MDAYVLAWRRRRGERRARCRQRAEEARVAAARCARLLASRYGAARVWLYGSLTTPELFHERSDIDLAAEGLERWFEALAACEAEAPGFSISLVPLEDTVPTLRRRILREGEVLHGPGR